MKELNKEYWQNRYLQNETGWDVGKITTPLKEYIDQISSRNFKILIPGCGNSYEFEYLLEKGFNNTTVLDFAEEPVKLLKSKVSSKFHQNILLTDFFEHNEKYDLIIEQTFFCALSPQLRESYVNKMYSLLNKGGKLVGLLFQFPLTTEGPPFGGSKEEYLNLFSELFDVKILETAYNSIKPRSGNELFFIFTKK